MTSTGRVATTTLLHKLQTCGFETGRPRRSPKGQSLFQNSTTTAMMAPSWITTRNMDRNASLASNRISCSASIMCPVEEMGSHSVTPSTTPISRALMISISIETPSPRRRCGRAYPLFPHSISYYEPLRTGKPKIFTAPPALTPPPRRAIIRAGGALCPLRPAFCNTSQLLSHL